jgi:hypothetical protein
MTFFNEEDQHCTIYVELRRAIFEHIDNENTSQLRLCEMSTKERAWQLIAFFVRDDEMNEIAQKLHIAEKEIVENDDLSMNFEELI